MYWREILFLLCLLCCGTKSFDSNQESKVKELRSQQHEQSKIVDLEKVVNDYIKFALYGPYVDPNIYDYVEIKSILIKKRIESFISLHNQNAVDSLHNNVSKTAWSDSISKVLSPHLLDVQALTEMSRTKFPSHQELIHLNASSPEQHVDDLLKEGNLLTARLHDIKMLSKCVNPLYRPRVLSVSQISWKKAKKESSAKNAKKSSVQNHTAPSSVDTGLTSNVYDTSEAAEDHSNEIIHPYLVFALVLPHHPYSSQLIHSLQQISPLFSGVTTVIGSAPEFTSFCREYHIKSFPKVLFFKNGFLQGSMSTSPDEKSLHIAVNMYQSMSYMIPYYVSQVISLLDGMVLKHAMHPIELLLHKSNESIVHHLLVLLHSVSKRLHSVLQTLQKHYFMQYVVGRSRYHDRMTPTPLNENEFAKKGDLLHSLGSDGGYTPEQVAVQYAKWLRSFPDTMPMPIDLMYLQWRGKIDELTWVTPTDERQKRMSKKNGYELTLGHYAVRRRDYAFSPPPFREGQTSAFNVSKSSNHLSSLINVDQQFNWFHFTRIHSIRVNILQSLEQFRQKCMPEHWQRFVVEPVWFSNFWLTVWKNELNLNFLHSLHSVKSTNVSMVTSSSMLLLQDTLLFLVAGIYTLTRFGLWFFRV